MGHIILIGGSIMGPSFAYHMAMAGHAGSLRVIEPDPTYALAAAPRSAGGVRLMHSLPENIEMSRYGQTIYRDFARLMDVDGEPGSFPFRDYGYLHPVAGSEAVAAVEQNWKVQTDLGANNELLTREQVAEKFPLMRTDDIDAGLWGPEDGFIDPYAAVTGFRRKAESLGVTYLTNRIVGLTTEQNKVTGVTLDSGEHHKAEIVVNVAGSWAPEIGAMLGTQLPVEPACRPTFYFETEDKLPHAAHQRPKWRRLPNGRSRVCNHWNAGRGPCWISLRHHRKNDAQGINEQKISPKYRPHPFNAARR